MSIDWQNSVTDKIVIFDGFVFPDMSSNKIVFMVYSDYNEINWGTVKIQHPNKRRVYDQTEESDQPMKPGFERGVPL